MSAQQIPAKGLLHSFLIQATKGKPPCYVTSDAKNIQGQFECTCTLPPVCIATGSFDAQTFTGIGTSKKLAAAKAADLAWAFVQQTKAADALLYKQAKHDLWAAICSSLTAEAVYKDHDLKCHIWLALLCNQGQLPGTVLCHAKAVSKWFRDNNRDIAGDVVAVWRAVSHTLYSHLGAGYINLEGLMRNGSGEDRRGVEGAPPNPLSLPVDEGAKHVKALQATLDLGTGRLYSVVMLPADPSQAPYEVTVEGGGYFPPKLLQILGGSGENAQLLYHGKVGAPIERLVLPGGEDADPENDQELHALLEQFYGALPSKKRRTTAEETVVYMLRQDLARVSEARTEIGPGLRAAMKTFSTAMERLQTVNVRRPSLYALADAALEWLDWQMVSREFARLQGLPLIAGIPNRYQTAKVWKGPSPEDTLTKLWNSGIMSSRAPPAMHCKMVETAQSRGYVAILALQPLGSAQPTSVRSALMASEAAARQDAALAALRQLDAHIRSIAFHRSSQRTHSRAPLPPHLLPATPQPQMEITIVEPGAGEKPCPPKPVGSMVEFKYSLRAPSEGNVLVEAGASCRATLKTGALAPELDALLDAIGIHGKARCQGLWRPEAWGVVDVEAELLDWRVPPAQALNVKLFDVPLSQQRYAFVLDVIRQHSAQSVVDLGCGDGKFLEYLLRQDVHLRALTGVDHNTELAHKAERRLATLYAQADQQGPAQSACPMPPEAQRAFGHLLGAPAAAPARLQATVLLADIVERTGAWGSLQGADAATMVEVIEHMDPHILAQVGQAVLGDMRPRVLVVTTPNAEYNPVLQCLGSSLLPNNTRNSDHRFEWSRAEFQAWAVGIACRFGYMVAFSGIGQATDEQKVLQDPSWPQELRDVGSASQATVFTRKEAHA